MNDFTWMHEASEALSLGYAIEVPVSVWEVCGRRVRAFVAMRLRMRARARGEALSAADIARLSDCYKVAETKDRVTISANKGKIQ